MKKVGIIGKLAILLAGLSGDEVVHLGRDPKKRLTVTIQKVSETKDERVEETTWIEQISACKVAAVDELIAAAHRNAGVPLDARYEDFLPDDPEIYLETLEELGVLGDISASATPKKYTGDLAQTSVMGDPIPFTAATTSASAVVTPVSMVGLAIGQSVNGPGVPVGASILSKTSSTITLTAAATATAAAAALTATPQNQVVGLGEWTLDWKRKTVEGTTTDDAEYESSLASTKSWSGKAKYMFIDADDSQEDIILAVLDLMETDTQTWNFFPTVESGRAAFQGDAIIDGITIAAGLGKVVGLDISLKGTGTLKKLTQRDPIASNTPSGQQALV